MLLKVEFTSVTQYLDLLETISIISCDLCENQLSFFETRDLENNFNPSIMKKRQKNLGTLASQCTRENKNERWKKKWHSSNKTLLSLLKIYISEKVSYVPRL